MLKIQEIRELIKLIDESSINEFKFEQNGSKVTLRKDVQGKVVPSYVPEQVSQSTTPQPKPVSADSSRSFDTVKSVEEQSASDTKDNSSNAKREGLYTISSPMVGTFYEAPSPDSPAYVKTGDRVKTESVVCIVEAMKLMNEIEAEIQGEIVEVLVENGQLVEYGQELFLVKPE